MKFLFVIYICLFFLFPNIQNYSQKLEIDNFEYTQELCEPKYWFQIFDKFYTDSSKAEIIAIHQDSIYYYFSSIQTDNTKKDKFYTDYDGSNLTNLNIAIEYFNFIFDKIYSEYHICKEYKIRYKFLRKDTFKVTLFNAYYNYLKNGNDKYEQILDSINNKIYEIDKLEDKFIPLDTINGVYIPKDIDDAINYLNINVDSIQIIEFKKQSEKDAVSSEHFGIGLWMRNNFRLWGKSRLQQFFKPYRIRNADHMSSIILKVWHRSLNNKEYKLNLIMSEYRKYENYDE